MKKLIINTNISIEYVKAINTLVPKLHHKTIKDIWDNIQHLDMFFNENLNAYYDERSNAIDFRDEDETTIFYIID